ncbi:hypothetical protein PCC7418_0048 [Halothece sp. PCC 7418]|uniref:ADP-ribosylglycohydrolase family protein n=1 Tax=Halothece sp. (strain PCC 7418) TaxID=65093 RepID=UPI0002A07F6F|nr:ADP-ribosylglycohydrolase family protein [Halothece sp. PCC 7418]AFZ42303.1 hypothetical protein PCC7418_0048 [Halothece sp. PCC 7418]
MRQTLLSRWEGALLGSTLPKIKTPSASEKVKTWGEKQAQGIRELAETGEWSPTLENHHDRASEILVLGLPLILFFSDQPERLEEQLKKIGQQPENTLTISAIIAYARAITWGVQETLSGKLLFHNLRETLNCPESYKVLETLQDSLEQGNTLQQTRLKLPLTCQEIWLALYCFAMTSENLTLSVRRVEKSKGSDTAILALVGALSGVHNGVNAIPVSWRCRLQKERTAWKENLRLMWATWSGSYKFGTLDPRLEQNAMTITSSGVIQPRQQKP